MWNNDEQCRNCGEIAPLQQDIDHSQFPQLLQEHSDYKASERPPRQDGVITGDINGN